MSARKLIYRLMVIAPAVFLAGLGVNARTMPTSFYQRENDPLTEKKVLAYAPVLKRLYFINPAEPSSWRSAKELALEWCRLREEGILQPLTPIEWEDTSTEGAKAQIFQAKSRLVALLLHQGRQLVEKQDAKEAAERVMLALAISESLKYSDFPSLFNSCSEQRRGVDILSSVFPKLSHQEQQKIASLLTQFAEPQQRTVSRMVTRTRQQFLIWHSSMGSKPLSIEDAKLLSELPTTFDGKGKIRAISTAQGSRMASNDATLPNLCSGVWLGLHSQNMLKKDVESLLSSGQSE